MNALHPAPEAEVRAAYPSGHEAEGARLILRLTACYGALALATLLALSLAPTTPLIFEARRSGLAGVGLAALLIGLAGLLATMAVASARLGWARGQRASTGRQRWWHGSHATDPDRRLAAAARKPQGIIVPILSLCAAGALWRLWPATSGAIAAPALLLGGIAVALAFPLLVAERVMAAVPSYRLAEAASLRALLRVPVIALPTAGLLEIAASQGCGWSRAGMAALGGYLGLVAGELGIRALANWFLPPPPPAQAHASVASLAALLLQPGSVSSGGLAAPIRAHLGLDFSRSWALRYVRSAALPVGLGLVLAGWALTGVSLVALDRRGIYERFGAPVAVWQPGAHIGLPWPLGRVRLVDLGVVHTLPLGVEPVAEAATSAEDAAPLSADRLWDRAHPAEMSYLIASDETSGSQSFQSVSVDLKVLYRTGLDDASALRAAYGIASADDLVRTQAGRLLARLFSGTVLNDVLGENRTTLAGRLRSDLGAELDRRHAGIELLGVVIEAIHPPLAAADAYHNVQAAEIVANTAVATERGRAEATAAMARQTATDLTNKARGLAAETLGQADVRAREFTADQAAARVGGDAFLMERYFANLTAALARSPLVVMDHRLRGADAPVIDLRSFGAPAGRPADDD